MEQAIRATLSAYLEAHPESRSTSAVRVARVSDRQRSKVQIVGVGALLGAGRSRRKARASRMNGRLGGRPPKTAKAALSTRLVRQGDVVAEVDVDLVEAMGGWAPYLSLDDAYRLAPGHGDDRRRGARGRPDRLRV